jgi:hypothetical protein
MVQQGCHYLRSTSTNLWDIGKTNDISLDTTSMLLITIVA